MVQRRNTRQRQLVLDAVEHLNDHPTAEEIYAYVHKTDEHVSRGTVYRNLNLLAQNGTILDVKVPGGDRFDHRTDCHPHLVCTECGAVVDAPYEADHEANARVESISSYSNVIHYTVFMGVCPACQRRLAQENGEGANSADNPKASSNLKASGSYGTSRDQSFNQAAEA